MICQVVVSAKKNKSRARSQSGVCMWGVGRAARPWMFLFLKFLFHMYTKVDMRNEVSFLKNFLLWKTINI